LYQTGAKELNPKNLREAKSDIRSVRDELRWVNYEILQLLPPQTRFSKQMMEYSKDSDSNEPMFNPDYFTPLYLYEDTIANPVLRSFVIDGKSLLSKINDLKEFISERST
jgi:hypothetical protein